MKPVTQLVRVKHGSHLYGTSTPASDQDFKGVHLPSGEAIVMQRAENVINTGVVSKNGLKNDADAIDSDSYSVQKFFEMLMKGDTVATEILFAPIESIVLPIHPAWWHVRQTGLKLLNRQCKGFVGYCVRQAAKYGIKGSRMAAVRALLDKLYNNPFGITPTMKLAALQPMLQAFAGDHEHAAWINIPSPNGTDLWHIECCDRKMPMTATIKEAYDVYNKVWENYGERARSAMNNENIDWKAVSHAVRVAGQAIELLDTGKITFPRPEAAYLLEIKQGRLAYDIISNVLEVLVQQVQFASERSALPEKSDHKLADTLVRQLYLEQVR